MSPKPKSPKKRLDPKKMYEAGVFIGTGEHILRNGTHDPQHPRKALLLCSTILSALVIEIFFKCIITLEGHDFGNTHDLEELFEIISASRQQQIMVKS
jgi:hypothetical protein